jgi:hypothetical protein
MTQHLELRPAAVRDLPPLSRPAFPWLQRIGRSPGLIPALTVITLCTVASLLTAILAPGLRGALLREDGIIEMGSVVILAGVVLWAGVATLVGGLRAPLVLGGLLGLAELMDETSFGARLFGFEPPALYGGGQLDGFHDLLILTYRLLVDVAPALGWLFAALILAIAAGAALLAIRLAGSRQMGAPHRLANHSLLFLHVALIALAQVIDIATHSRAMSAVEEVLEFNAAVVLAFYVMWPEAQFSHRSG